ncbi:MAG: hypothetical protein EPO02_13605 [Nitrospirae bacterium]|nr:MAG: hypothetical protein EPO02_13605 [Nitrospirota bacterium]
MQVFFQNHQITIYRNRKVANKDKFSMSATLTVYDSDIQPATDQRTEFVGGRIGATFTAFVDSNVPIKEGDQVLTEDGKRYSVRGVANYSGAGLLDHTELTMTAQDG